MNDKQQKEADDFHKTFEDSVKRLQQLQNGRSFGDIGINDEYWLAQQVHTALYNGSRENKVSDQPVVYE